MNSLLPPVTFPAQARWIAPDWEGTAALLSYLAKPTNPSAIQKKLSNWKRWMTPGESTEQRRSRRQVEAGILDVWSGLHAAVKIGERFAKMAIYHEGSSRSDAKKKALADWIAPVGPDDLTQWKNWLPLAHYAAGFRVVLYKRNIGRAFNLETNDRARIRAVHNLLLGDQGWVPEVLEAGFGWLLFARYQARVQSPADTLVLGLKTE